MEDNKNTILWRFIWVPYIPLQITGSVVSEDDVTRSGWKGWLFDNVTGLKIGVKSPQTLDSVIKIILEE